MSIGDSPVSAPQSHAGAAARPHAGFKLAGNMRSDMETVALTELDLRLVEQLQADGRIPFAELARRVGVTEKTVRRRVSHLLDESFIQISAVTDPSLLGFGALALALLTIDGTRDPAALAEDLALLPEVDYVTVTTGPFAVQAELMCIDGKELHDVVARKIRTIPGIRAVEILPYLRLHYQQATFSAARLNEKREGVRPRPLDAMDQTIISELADNGRASFREIAARLNVSETTIRLRYAKLVDSEAVRVMCIVNPLRLGYHFSCWVGIRLGQGARAADVAEGLTALPSVSYVIITAGRFDVLAEVVTSTGENLLAILDEQIRVMVGVRELETWLYADLHYKALRPRRGPAEEPHARDIQTV
ncbi:Lrp/AsnC family transcriptional regulator [Paeniglutamicibacter sulfureus]|nr:Lrp/AsnC family transcriptional regulator [Paeniglutamicibacter sulfureus]MDO2934171.1 Lrp/AsnC family transcriptional regulator [Paeniglutamicibacter sulfureus]